MFLFPFFFCPFSSCQAFLCIPGVCLIACVLIFDVRLACFLRFVRHCFVYRCAHFLILFSFPYLSILFLSGFPFRSLFSISCISIFVGAFVSDLLVILYTYCLLVRLVCFCMFFFPFLPPSLSLSLSLSLSRFVFSCSLLSQHREWINERQRRLQ